MTGLDEAARQLAEAHRQAEFPEPRLAMEIPGHTDERSEFDPIDCGGYVIYPQGQMVRVVELFFSGNLAGWLSSHVIEAEEGYCSPEGHDVLKVLNGHITEANVVCPRR